MIYIHLNQIVIKGECCLKRLEDDNIIIICNHRTIYLMGINFIIEYYTDNELRIIGCIKEVRFDEN